MSSSSDSSLSALVDISEDQTLRLYSVIRSDLEMSPGKIASQAGHAYLGAYLASVAAVDPYRAQALDYGLLTPGTKVCLVASGKKLMSVRAYCQSAGIPHFLVVDSGCPNFYGGDPIVTALGIGPLSRKQAKPVVGKLRLHN